jgi:hypothetical protein
VLLNQPHLLTGINLAQVGETNDLWFRRPVYTRRPTVKNEHSRNDYDANANYE